MGSDHHDLLRRDRTRDHHFDAAMLPAVGLEPLGADLVAGRREHAVEAVALLALFRGERFQRPGPGTARHPDHEDDQAGSQDYRYRADGHGPPPAGPEQRL